MNVKVNVWRSNLWPNMLAAIYLFKNFSQCIFVEQINLIKDNVSSGQLTDAFDTACNSNKEEEFKMFDRITNKLYKRRTLVKSKF